MFARVTLLASDREASSRFYETVLPAVGGEAWSDVAIEQSDGPVTRRLHVAFFASAHADVDAFWQAGVDAGYADDGEPGPRPQYGPDYYGGFLLDPDGNSAEAVHHGEDRIVGRIDHMWIRVADVAAAKRSYLDRLRGTGFELGTDKPERVQFRGPRCSFSLVAGEPTEHVHFSVRGADGNVVEVV